MQWVNLWDMVTDVLMYQAKTGFRASLLDNPLDRTLGYSYQDRSWTISLTDIRRWQADAPAEQRWLADRFCEPQTRIALLGKSPTQALREVWQKLDLPNSAVPDVTLFDVKAALVQVAQASTGSVDRPPIDRLILGHLAIEPMRERALVFAWDTLKCGQDIECLEPAEGWSESNRWLKCLYDPRSAEEVAAALARLEEHALVERQESAVTDPVYYAL